jgi:hypothetical protein
MQDGRQYKRYSLDIIEIHGKMSLTDKVEILDISLGGIALSFADKIADFLRPIEQTRKKESPVVVDRRLSVRFNITSSQEKILSFPEHCKVKTISLSGLLIQTDQAVEINSTIPLELSLNTGKAVMFIGRAVSCTKTEQAGQTNYDIGVEFTDLTEKDRLLLKTFIDYLATREAHQKG